MKFSIHQATSVGGRPVNEDRVGYAYSREALLMVLSDGMGGHAAGEVAAQITLQSLIQAFRLSAKPRVEDPLSFLSQAIINAHYAILEYARVNHIEGNPRATVVTCLVQEGGYAWWAHVGDSRLYHIRHGKVLTRTIDHSHAQLLIEQGCSARRSCAPTTAATASIARSAGKPCRTSTSVGGRCCRLGT